MGKIRVVVRTTNNFKHLNDTLVGFLQQKNFSIEGHKLEIVNGDYKPSQEEPFITRTYGDIIFNFSYCGENEKVASLDTIAEEYKNRVDSLLREDKKLSSLLPIHLFEYLNTAKDIAKREFMNAHTFFSANFKQKSNWPLQLSTAEDNRNAAAAEWKLGVAVGVGALLTGIFLTTTSSLLGLIAVALICLAIYHETKANHLSPKDGTNNFTSSLAI